MSELKLKPIDYGGIGGEKEDPILNDDTRLAAAAALFENPGLRDVLEVHMTKRAFYLVNRAEEGELFPVRHEISSAEQVYEQVAKYHAEWKARVEKKRLAQTNEDKPVK